MVWQIERERGDEVLDQRGRVKVEYGTTCICGTKLLRIVGQLESGLPPSELEATLEGGIRATWSSQIEYQRFR